MLITIITTIGAAAAIASGVVAGRRDPEPAMIPIPVDRPRRPRG
ncbi:hypothetical protein [Ilumatobacter sp.]